MEVSVGVLDVLAVGLVLVAAEVSAGVVVAKLGGVVDAELSEGGVEVAAGEVVVAGGGTTTGGVGGGDVGSRVGAGAGAGGGGDAGDGGVCSTGVNGCMAGIGSTTGAGPLAS